MNTKEKRIEAYSNPEVGTTIVSLANAIRAWAQDKGFEDHVDFVQGLLDNAESISDEDWDRARGIINDLFTGQQVALTVSELGEFLDYVRKPGMDDHIPVDGRHAEWADALVRHLHLGHRIGIERCVQAFEAKLKYNEDRPSKHGNKAF